MKTILLGIAIISVLSSTAFAYGDIQFRVEYTDKKYYSLYTEPMKFRDSPSFRIIGIKDDQIIKIEVYSTAGTQGNIIKVYPDHDSEVPNATLTINGESIPVESSYMNFETDLSVDDFVVFSIKIWNKNASIEADNNVSHKSINLRHLANSAISACECTSGKFGKDGQCRDKDSDYHLSRGEHFHMGKDTSCFCKG